MKAGVESGRKAFFGAKAAKQRLQGIAPIRWRSVVDLDWSRIVIHIEKADVYIFSEPALAPRRDRKRWRPTDNPEGQIQSLSIIIDGRR